MWFGLGVLAMGGWLVPTASAQTLFSDNFENEGVSDAAGAPVVGAPDVGQSWTEGPASGGHGIDIVASPAIGTRSMRVLREGVPPLGPSNGRADGLSLPGAIVAGNLVEVKWSNQLSTLGDIDHRFNGPMQMSIGHAGSGYNNDLAFILVNDANSGSYHYSNSTTQYAGSTATTVQPSLDAWDTLRAVLSIQQISPTSMGGTYDLFVSLGGGAEQQLADDALLFNTDLTMAGAVADPTSMQLRIGKGPSTAQIFYDDISVTLVPEPASLMTLGSLAGCLLLMRRRGRNC
jgi:hypothetical protein